MSRSSRKAGPPGRGKPARAVRDGAGRTAPPKAGQARLSGGILADHRPNRSGESGEAGAVRSVQNRRTMSTPASECVFCAIVAGRAPATVVHRDARTIAFLDTRQANPGHVLVVPRAPHRGHTRRGCSDRGRGHAGGVEGGARRRPRVSQRRPEHLALDRTGRRPGGAAPALPRAPAAPSTTACCACIRRARGGRGARPLTRGARGFAPPSTRSRDSWAATAHRALSLVLGDDARGAARRFGARPAALRRRWQVVAAAWQQFDGSDFGVGGRFAWHSGRAARRGGRARPLSRRVPRGPRVQPAPRRRALRRHRRAALRPRPAVRRSCGPAFFACSEAPEPFALHPDLPAAARVHARRRAHAGGVRRRWRHRGGGDARTLHSRGRWRPDDCAIRARPSTADGVSQPSSFVGATSLRFAAGAGVRF